MLNCNLCVLLCSTVKSCLCHGQGICLQTLLSSSMDLYDILAININEFDSIYLYCGKSQQMSQGALQSTEIYFTWRKSQFYSVV